MEARTLPCFRSSHHSRGKHHDTSYQPEDAVNGYAKDVAQSIKPCLMMSPLSVSQFLPSVPYQWFAT